MIHGSMLRAALGGLVILTIGACSAAVKSNGAPEVPASELIEGDWTVTKYRIIYDAAPDNPIDVTDSSDIFYFFEDGAYGYACFPACLGITKVGLGTYVIDESRKTIRFTETQTALTPEFAHLARQLPAEARATYQFPSRDRLHLDQRMETLSPEGLVQARVIVEADRVPAVPEADRN